MIHRTIFTETVLRRGAVEVIARHFPATNLALVHNQLPVVTQIVAVNRSGTLSSAEFAVAVTLESTEGRELAPAETIRIPELGPLQEHYSTERGFVRPTHREVVGRTESYPAELTFRLDGDPGVAVETVPPTWVEAYEEVHGTPPDLSEQLVQQPDFRVLADNEWINSPVFYESLAAFVQPNVPEVRDVLATASDLLEKKTGDGALQGYQAGPERAALIALAVYEAFRSRGIRYINPPASFEGTGQRVRTTSEVLTTGFGTCIDLSVAYAACCEQAGLHPVLIVVHGHAMTGIMVGEHSASAPVIYEEGAIRNLVTSRMVLPVDAVYYGATTFDQAVAGGRALLSSTPTYGLVDVHASRRDGIRPLPTDLDGASESAGVAVSDGAFTSVPAQDAWALPSLGLDDDTGEEGERRAVKDDGSPARIQRWKQTLLDLSFRNRLLNLRPNAEVLELVLPADGLAELDDLIHAGKSIELYGHDAVSDNRKLQGILSIDDLPESQLLDDLATNRRAYVRVTEARYRNQLRGLARKVKTYFEETGSANLYLTLGSMELETPSGKKAQAPLFLIPVKITGGTGRSRFGIVADSSNDATPNHCLIEWLRDRHGATIPSLSEPPVDASGLDITKALSDISRMLSALQLPFEVRETAYVGVCRFSTYGMWRDLEEHWECFNRSPVFRHLVEKSGSDFVDGLEPGDLRDITVDEESLALPIQADGAQMRAVVAAAQGRTFVLEGPPGTGKSQTITNLIVQAMLEGKKLLFVAEKQAALDVVQRRLRAIGLDHFTLDLHGLEQAPANIRKQLKASLDIDVTYEDRAWRTLQDRYAARLRPLVEYPSHIHSENGAGFSLWQAVAMLDTLGEGPALPVEEKVVTNPDFEALVVEDALRTFEREARVLEPGSRPEWLLVGPRASRVDDETVADSLARFESAYAGLPAPLRDELRESEGAVTPTAALTPLVQHLEELRDHGESPAATLESGGSRQDAQRCEALAAKLASFHSRIRPLRAIVDDEALIAGDFRAAAQAAAGVDEGIFGKKKRLAALRAQLATLVTDPDSVAPQNVAAIASDVERARSEMTALENEINSIATGFFGRSSLDPSLPRDLIDRASVFMEIADSIDRQATFAREHPRLRALIADHGIGYEHIDAVTACADAWTAFLGQLDASDERVEAWMEGASWPDRIEQVLPRWQAELADSGGATIRRVARHQAALGPLYAHHMNAAADALLSGAVRPEETTAALNRGLAEASIRERLRAAGLEDFDSHHRDGEVEEFVRAADRLRREAPAALAAQLIERRPFRPGRLDGEYGDLARQLNAKRGGLTFRQLMMRYGRAITEVTPCLFVSPASLAKFVPADAELFDLVIFDEASQVTVDQAVGALGRAHSAVIVGDSQQMPPTRIGQATIGVDEDFDIDADPDTEIVPVDLESILTECVESGLPRLWLTWHYRSQDERLIAFSNDQYYEGNLSSLPGPGGEVDAGIEVRRVADGHFYRKGEIPRSGIVPGVSFRYGISPRFNTNPAEAEAIVDEIVSRVSDPALAAQSIGVVTFNIQQRDLILDALEACDDPLVRARLDDDVDPLVVKNLENVQGDERDVILFSIAFSAKTPGGPLPMNFGPLNQSGGERRLNVAVTRARRKVVVFCSFDASDMDLGRTSSKGVADLRGYLESADLKAEESKRWRHDANSVRADLAERLRDRGFEVAEEYGLSEFTVDLAVRAGGARRWQCAILLDSPRWADMPTVSDREVTPELLDSLMGWGGVERVWLPEWHARAESVVDRLASAVHAAGEVLAMREAELEARRVEQESHLAEERARRAAEVDAERPDQRGDGPDADADDTRVVWSEAEEVAVVEEDVPSTPSHQGRTPNEEQVAGGTSDLAPDSSAPVPVAEVATHAISPAPGPTGTSKRADGVSVVPFTPVADETLGMTSDLAVPVDPSIRERIRDRLERVVAAEAPMTPEELARRIASCFGVKRVSRKTRDVVLADLPREWVSSTHGEEFVWPEGTTPESFTLARTGTGRSLADTPIEEICNAMRVLRVDQRDSMEERFRVTLAHFDQRRLTEQAKLRLEKAWVVLVGTDGR